MSAPPPPAAAGDDDGDVPAPRPCSGAAAAPRKRPRVPEPPPALVRLIRTDAAVWDYMRALQANLERDVEVWRDRAARYRAALREAQQRPPRRTKRQREEPPGRRKGKGTVRSQRNGAATPKTKDTAPLRIGESMGNGGHVLDSDAVAVDDAMFEVSSSSESDSEPEPVPTALEPELALSFEADVLPLLDEALGALERIGIPLVDEPAVVRKAARGDDADVDDAGPETAPPAAAVPVRRSDAQVVADLLYQVHAWTRLEGAFDPRTLALHPVLEEGCQLLFRALVVLDTFDTTDEEVLSKSPSRYAGLRGSRKALVEALLQTLSAEISETWACQGRTHRLQARSLHYHPKRPPVAAATSDDAVEVMETDGTDPAPAANGRRNLELRLAPLVRARLLAELAVSLHLSRGDYVTAADTVFNYLVSTAPTSMEDYPTLPPMQSFVVLQGLLLPRMWFRLKEDDNNGPTRLKVNCWFIETICQASKEGVNEDKSSASLAREFLCQAIRDRVQYTASIWKERSTSNDLRIRSVAQVEYACYQQLLATESSWLGNDSNDAFLVSASDEPAEAQALNQTTLTKAQILANVVGMDVKIVLDSLRKALLNRSISLIVPLAEACRQLILRQFDMFQAYSSEATDLTKLFNLTEIMERTLEQNKTACQIEDILVLGSQLIKCCEIISDGKAVVEILKSVIQQTKELDHQPENSKHVIEFFQTICSVSESPCVYIINLQRRSDRRRAIMAQIMREKLLAALAVVPVESHFTGLEKQGVEGSYAFDGSIRMFAAQARSWANVGGRSASTKHLVETQWRPSDLRPFDINAPNDEARVSMSETEIACALSHIASWCGAYRVLRFDRGPTDSDNEGVDVPQGLFHYPLHTVRRLRLSGFARGAPLLTENTDMAPAPTVVILEDDAVLVDRFRDRLEELLEELPRDFHFCSIGYSRPKTAPIVPYSSQCGVPTHLFYMTGYLLSEQGIEHLISSLPVVGPVDSFIGGTMTSNWDNVFGQTIGVGIQSKPISSPVSKKDLASILKFRAFCALQPLCSQRVGSSGQAERSWRERDTDIQYSGASRRPNHSNGI